MPRQIIHKDVEWERASCRGLDTDLFFANRTELLTEGLSFHHLRRICIACPIMEQCLKVGTAYEQYGFWGGLSEEERSHVYNNKETRITLALRRDLKVLGIEFDYIKRIVKSVVRNFAYASERNCQ